MKKFFVIVLFVLFATCALACQKEYKQYYMAGKEVVYGFSAKSGEKVKNADRKSFGIIEGTCTYAKDKENVFYAGNILSGAHTATFRYLGGVDYDGYAIDTNNVYWQGYKIDKADTKTFELIPSGLYYLDGYAKDTNNVYFNGAVIPRDVASFKLLSYGYSIDKNGIYYFNGVNHIELQGADVKGYEHKRDYLISNNSVYLFGEKATLWDASSFQVVISSEAVGCDRYHYYALTMDKNGVYYNQVKVDSCQDFRVVYNKYWYGNALNEMSTRLGIKKYLQHPRTIYKTENTE